MGLGKMLLLVTFSAVIAAVLYDMMLKESPTFPAVFFNDHYWGRKITKAGEKIPKDSGEIRKFVVKVEDKVIQELKQHLNKTHYALPLPNSRFHYGFNGVLLKKVVDYWTQIYDWKKQEKELNKYNHYKTEIEGIDLHFIQVKPAKVAKHTVSLILVHGWPGTFVEYLKMIPLLTTVENDVTFELVIPSIPGYGFSEEPHQQGFSAVHAARVFHKLMTKLGYKKYYYYGGDWGSIIGRYIASMYPEHISGYHTQLLPNLRMNPIIAIQYALVYFLPNIFSDHPQEEAKLLKPFKEKAITFNIRESGYMHLQSTKPDTIGAALLNSPAGLAAYILEKFSTWTNKDYVNLEDGGLTKHFTYDELLTNVMVYYVTSIIHSSVRFYKENFSGTFLDHPEIDGVPVKVPAGLSVPPNEILYMPKLIAKQIYKNLLHYNYLPRGGHFAAFEEPQLIAREVRVFVAKCIGFHKQIEEQQLKETEKADRKKK